MPRRGMGTSQERMQRNPSPRGGAAVPGTPPPTGPLRSLVAIAAICASILAIAPTALAHPTDTFVACAAHRRTGGECSDTAFFGTWQVVRIRGKVRPVHEDEEAVVLMQRPASQIWRQVSTVHISAFGKMRYWWRPTDGDAHPSKPYRFKFKIRDHGASDGVRTYLGRTPAEIAVQAAYSVLGTRYVRNSGIPEVGLDCSGLTEWSWAQAGVDIPGSASTQYNGLRRIRLSGVRPGDLIYYSSVSPHIAMYIGDKRIIHATGPGYKGRVRIDSMYGYDKPRGAVRVKPDA